MNPKAFLTLGICFGFLSSASFLFAFYNHRLAFPAQAALSQPIHIKNYPIATPRRLQLTREYCRLHYGTDSYQLINPEMIVIHDTEIPSVKESLRVFKENYFPEFRKEERVSHGKVNVGVHFLVDPKGKIYSLLPTNVVGRHIVGFNHVALGIENVAEDGAHLTRKQLEADAALVEMLSGEYPSIHYLIGHHEYLRRQWPHFKLFKELISDDKPEPKRDPGDRFMADLRERVKRDGFELDK